MRAPTPWAAVGVVVGLVLVLGWSVAGAQSPAAVPSASAAPAPGLVDPWANATLVQPRDDLVDVQPRDWERILVAPNGQQLTVYFWNGVPECYGLAGVDAALDPDGALWITVRTGRVPGEQACRDLAQPYGTLVQLPDQLIRGGHLE